MATYTFDYTRDRLDPSAPFPDGQDLYRPILKLRLAVPRTGKQVSLTAIVDSGADHCLFPLALTSALGLDPLALNSTTTGGVGNAANETKGYDPLQEIKEAAAQRWVAAVNADGQFGQWAFRMVTKLSEVGAAIAAVARPS